MLSRHEHLTKPCSLVQESHRSAESQSSSFAEVGIGGIEEACCLFYVLLHPCLQKLNLLVSPASANHVGLIFGRFFLDFRCLSLSRGPLCEDAQEQRSALESLHSALGGHMMFFRCFQEREERIGVVVRTKTRTTSVNLCLKKMAKVTI